MSVKKSTYVIKLLTFYVYKFLMGLGVGVDVTANK